MVYSINVKIMALSKPEWGWGCHLTSIRNPIVEATMVRFPILVFSISINAMVQHYYSLCYNLKIWIKLECHGRNAYVSNTIPGAPTTTSYIDLARNGNSGYANEILGCAKWHFWRKFPWKWKNWDNLGCAISFVTRANHRCTGGWLILWPYTTFEEWKHG